LSKTKVTELTIINGRLSDDPQALQLSQMQVLATDDDDTGAVMRDERWRDTAAAAAADGGGAGVAGWSEREAKSIADRRRHCRRRVCECVCGRANSRHVESQRGRAVSQSITPRPAATRISNTGPSIPLPGPARPRPVRSSSAVSLLRTEREAM